MRTLTMPGVLWAAHFKGGDPGTLKDGELDNQAHCTNCHSGTPCTNISQLNDLHRAASPPNTKYGTEIMHGHAFHCHGTYPEEPTSIWANSNGMCTNVPMDSFSVSIFIPCNHCCMASLFKPFFGIERMVCHCTILQRRLVTQLHPPQPNFLGFWNLTLFFCYFEGCFFLYIVSHDHDTRMQSQ